MLPRAYTYFVLGILAYGAIGAILYGPRGHDFKRGRATLSEGGLLEKDRYTSQGLDRMRRGRWMAWLCVPYILILGEVSGVLHWFGP